MANNCGPAPVSRASESRPSMRVARYKIGRMLLREIEVSARLSNVSGSQLRVDWHALSDLKAQRLLFGKADASGDIGGVVEIKAHASSGQPEANS